jgi:spore coat polysaccharide biosynthesis predicted glycosyltransferase SpsG
MIFLISSLDKKIGMGHSVRCKYLKDAIQDSGISVTHLDLMADESLNDNYLFKSIGGNQSNHIFIFDLHHLHINEALIKLFVGLKKSNNFLIGLDCLIDLSAYLDYLWIPSLFINQETLKEIKCDYRFGLDSILLPKIKNNKNKNSNNAKVLTICSGASDVSFLGDWLLDALQQAEIKTVTKIIWIQGPYAKKPDFNTKMNRDLEIEIIKSPSNLISILQESDFILTVYGITAFEALACNIPTMVFSPYGTKDRQNLTALKDLAICDVSMDISMLARDAKNFFENSEKHTDIIYNLRQLDFSIGLSQFVELVTKKLI